MTAAIPAESGAASQDIAPDPAQKRAGSSSFDYFKQILPDAPIVCGLALKPLSIGRYRRMRRQGVAFVAEEVSEATAGDLLKGVLICSMTCADYDEFILSKDCAKEVRNWGERVGLLPPRYHRWPIVGGWIRKFVGEEIEQKRAERDLAYIYEQIKLFSKYIHDAQIIPNYTRKDNNPSRHTMHWSNSIELHLRSEQNWTTKEIDEAPLSKALADYFGYAESHGFVSIITDKDMEDADANAKALEKLLEAMKEKK